jgi:hypothetical protein
MNPFPGDSAPPGNLDPWIVYVRQFNELYLHLCQYCQATNNVEKWIELQNDLKAKLEYVSRTVSYYPKTNSLIFDVENYPHHSSVEELEEIKKVMIFIFFFCLISPFKFNSCSF